MITSFLLSFMQPPSLLLSQSFFIRFNTRPCLTLTSVTLCGDNVAFIAPTPHLFEEQSDGVPQQTSSHELCSRWSPFSRFQVPKKFMCEDIKSIYWFFFSSGPIKSQYCKWFNSLINEFSYLMIIFGELIEEKKQYYYESSTRC